MHMTATEIRLRMAESDRALFLARSRYLENLHAFSHRLMVVMYIRLVWVQYNPQRLLTYTPKD